MRIFSYEKQKSNADTQRISFAAKVDNGYEKFDFEIKFFKPKFLPYKTKGASS